MKTKLFYILPVLLLGFVYLGFVVYPLVETVRESLRINGEFSFSTYIDILSFNNSANFEAVWNSVFVSLFSVLFSCVVGVFFAFVLTQCDFPLRNLLSRLAILPIALPPLVGVIAFLFVFGESGIIPRVVQRILGVGGTMVSLDGFSAIVAIHTYSFYVYFYLFVSTSLRNLDASQLEAAQVLGSSTWRTIKRIVLPEVRPALLGASILTFMASMASFSAPLLFGGERRFMTLQIYNAKLNGELNVASALAVCLTIVSILFFVLFKYISRQSSSAGKNKGVSRVGAIPLSKRIQRILITLCVLLLALELLPILLIILISFAKEGSWTWQILPTTYTQENYIKLLSDAQVFDPIVNSILMAMITVVVCVMVGVSFAYLLTKGILRRAKFSADILATFPFAIPGTVVAISLILAFNKPSMFAGQAILVGTFWILPLAYFIRMFPLVVRSTSASLEQLDDSLLEAGQTFGANVWQRFYKIALPIILPGIVSGSLLVMITALGEFVSSVLLYTYSNRPISVEILAQMRTYNFGAAAAYSVLLLILILLITFLSNQISKANGSANQTFNI